jgi:hypothetical protein
MENGKLQAYAWPGGYPLYYVTADGGTLCADCACQSNVDYKDASDKQWHIVGADVNWEDDSLHCSDCDKQIESAYGEQGQ